MLVQRVLVATLAEESVHYQKIAQNPRAPLGNTAVARHRLCGCVPRANGGKDVQLDRAADCFWQVECGNRLKHGKRGSLCTGRTCRNSWQNHIFGLTSYVSDQ